MRRYATISRYDMKLNKSQKFVIKQTVTYSAILLFAAMALYNIYSEIPAHSGSYDAAAKTVELFGAPSKRVDGGERFAVININTADKETLCEIDGIGEAAAEEILKYREEHGAFSEIDELLNVKGIGEKTLEKIRDRITL